MTRRRVFGLVCSGGGTIGAYQVGVLKFITERFLTRRSTLFDVYSGISVGAINATFLASRSDNPSTAIDDLERTWRDFHVPNYHARLLPGAMRAIAKRLLRPPFAKVQTWSLLDPRPMQQVILRNIRRDNLQRCLQRGTTRGVAVAATELASAFPVWFVEGQTALAWDRFHSLGKIDQISPQHVIASCSIPFFFPPTRIGEHYFLDGGANLPRPLTGALALGATDLIWIGSNVPRTRQLRPYPANFRPGARAVAKLVLNVLTRDHAYGEVQEIKLLNRFYQQVRPLLSTAPGEQMPDGSADAADPMRAAPNAVFDTRFNLADYQAVSVTSIVPSAPPSDLFRQFVAEERASGRLASHEFMFHRGFIERLIDLGYRDARARRADLERYFGDSD